MNGLGQSIQQCESRLTLMNWSMYQSQQIGSSEVDVPIIADTPTTMELDSLVGLLR